MKGWSYVLNRKINSKLNKICAIIMIAIITLGNTYYRPVEVKASADPTLGEFILSLFASQGLGLCDPNILSAVQSTMGNAIAVGAEGIQNAITAFETATGGCDVITKTFTTTAGQAVTYVQQVGAENIIYVKEFGASAAENISAAIENYQNFGYVAPAVGGMSFIPTVGTAVLAVGAGVGLGIALNQFREWVTPYVKSALSIDKNIPSGFTSGSTVFCTQTTEYYTQKWAINNNNDSNIVVGWWTDSRGWSYPWVKNLGASTKYNVLRYPDYYYQNNIGYHDTSYVISYANGQLNSFYGGLHASPSSITAVPIMYSPDVITPDGNLNTTSPMPDEELEPTYVRPIPMDDYVTWADLANANSGANNMGDEQGQLLQDLIDRYILPNGPIPAPTPVPTLAPDPDGVPQGPMTDPQPVNPAQPTFIPQPNPTLAPDAQPSPYPVVSPYPEADPQTQQDILKNGRLHGLENFFPFCIPFDFADLLRKFNGIRHAPEITWDVSFGQWGNFGQIVLDLSMFDDVAALLRTFETILYMVGLMMVTKNLTGWGG